MMFVGCCGDLKLFGNVIDGVCVVYIMGVISLVGRVLDFEFECCGFEFCMVLLFWLFVFNFLFI